MKLLKMASAALLAAFLPAVIAGCAAPAQQTDAEKIVLDDSGITLNGTAVGSDPSAAVYTANDIIYYESGKDHTYGEGSEADAHTAEEAAAHTVVHITKPGSYRISGTLSLGQIAVDLGEEAEKDPNAVVTLILDGADITCEAAPAVIFYNVYECGSNDAETAVKDPDTSAAGARVIIADGTSNTVRGSYVARIYKPDSVVLDENGQVEDAKKLHKYDGAFYSKMSMNIDGEKKGTGELTIYAENEGLDSELHLTLNGGNIHIFSGNDGINTNEDNVSVTTINGGNLDITVTGDTGEGDGIDSNGWLVINGGTVTASACADSADAGIDSDMGIHINGGTVIAGGHMLDRIEESGTYAVFTFGQLLPGGSTLTLKDEKEKTAAEFTLTNDCSTVIYADSALKAGSYTLWSGEQQLAHGGSFGGMMGGMRPGGGFREDMTPPEGFDGEMPEGMTPPEGFDGEMPEGMTPPEGFDGEMPEGMTRPEGFDGEIPEGMTPPEGFDGEMPEGMTPPEGFDGGKGGFGKNRGEASSGELSTEFRIAEGANMFSSVTFTE
ncbi:MAG: carbohydrate-binding domain-containing protein [Oscillospiraceae bacterium]|nr:carbohydrate-binding domain-containing protein [Oscillospiraceae bacterium]